MIDKRKINLRRFFNMDNMVEQNIMTDELANKIQDMLTSPDIELQELGEIMIQPFRLKYYRKMVGEYPTFVSHAKII